MYIRIINNAASLVLIAFLSACGGGGGGSSSSSSQQNTDDTTNSESPTETTSTGYFIDAAVSGITYSTTTTSGSSLSGQTGTNGEYQYFPGRNITFRLGGLILGVEPGSALTTPYSFVDDSTHEDFPQNMAQLLLSIDSNQDANDGIQISALVQAGFSEVRGGLLEMLDQSSSSFESDFRGFINSSLPDYSTHVVDASDAQSHLNQSMDAIDYQLSLPGSVWRTELQPIHILAWNNVSEEWVSYQSCSNGIYDLYVVNEYSASGVETTSLDNFDMPTCSPEGEEVVEALRDYDVQTLCGYRLAGDSEADVTRCSFADLNNKVAYTDGDGVNITLYISHAQDSNVVRQTILREYTQGEPAILLREKWQAVITKTTAE